MAKNIKKIARALGAEIVAQVPATGGGAFGVARLGHVVTELQGRLKPSKPTAAQSNRGSSLQNGRGAAAG